MPLHVKCKLFLKKILPVSIFRFLIKTWRTYFSRFFNDDGADSRYYDLYISQFGLTVTGGPFTGLKYIPESAGSVLLLKLIGCYEEVLHKTIEKNKRNSYDTIIDIGCAEGYYLIGFGKNNPQAKLVGYDIDTHALQLTKMLAEHNDLGNKLVLEKTCTPEKLGSDIQGNTLLICDAEGFEKTILNLELCPELKKVSDYIIETHEFAAPGVVATLSDRLKQTHNIELITFATAKASKYPFITDIKNKKHLYHLLRERGEQEQQWIIAYKKHT